MEKIHTLVSDLATTGSRDWTFGKHNIITAPNRGGKTTLLTGLALALTGGLDDYLGRGTAGAGGKPVRAPAEIARYMGPGRDGMDARVIFDSGETAEYALTRNRKGEISRTHNVPPVFRTPDGKDTVWTTLPVREVHAKLAAGPDTARTFFLPYIVPPDVLSAQLPKALTDQDRERLKERSLVVPTTYDGIIALIGTAKLQAADYAQISEEEGRTADRLAAIHNEPTEIAVLAAEAIAAEARSAYQAALSRQAAARPNLDGLLNEIQVLETERAKLAAKWAGYTVGQLPPEPMIPSMEQAIGRPPEDVERAQQWLASTARPALALAQIATSACACCGSPTDGARLAAYWQEQIAQAERFISGASEGWKQREAWYLGEVARVRGEHDAAVAAVAARDAQYHQDLAIYHVYSHQITEKQSAYTAASAMGAAAPSDGPEISITEYEKRCAAADQALAGIREGVNVWARIREARSRSAMMGGLADWWADLHTRLKAWADKLIESSLGGFADRVGAYLPAAWGKVSFVLETDTGAKTFRVSFDRGGHEVVPMCGAEWAAVVLAISAVILDQIQPAYGALTLVSDLGWHPDVLTEVMTALSACRWQIFIASCVVPAEVPGWSILHLGGAPAPVPAATGAEPARRPRRKRGEAATESNAAPAVDAVADTTTGGAQPATVETTPEGATDRLLQARATFLTLQQLGWPDRVIHKMSADTLEIVSKSGYTPQTHSVLADGSLHPIVQPTLDAFQQSRSP